MSHKGEDLTSKLNSKTVTVLPSLIFPFHLLPSLVHSTRFSLYIFPGFLAIFILLKLKDGSRLIPSLIFPFHLLPSPVHPTGFSFYFFPDFLVILSPLNNGNLRFLYTLLFLVGFALFNQSEKCIYIKEILFYSARLGNGFVCV